MMRLTTLVFGAAGYVLGARAGHERYEAIVRYARRVAGSQTVQSTAGVVQAQLDTVGQQLRQVFAGRLAGNQQPVKAGSGVNGHGG